MTYRDRIRQRMLEACDRIVARYIGCQLTIKESPCEYGQFYVSVDDNDHFSGYLYPDLTVRAYANQGRKSPYHGYYRTRDDAQKVIDNFRIREREISSMCRQATSQIDPQLRGIIDNALQDFINQGEMFTAFDVTRKVRNDNAQTGVYVYHEVVKAYVHDKFEADGSFVDPRGHLYDRQTIPVGNPPPWLYYIPGVHKVSNYGGLASQPIASSPTRQDIIADGAPDGVPTATPPQKPAKPATHRTTAPKPVMATFGGFIRD